MSKPHSFIQELEALNAVLSVLEPLDDAKRRFVLATATERLGLSNAAPATHHISAASPILPATTPTSDVATLNGVSAKDFLFQKRPATDVQRIACLAFFLTHAMNQTSFATRELTKLNTEAKASPMSNPAFAVQNATTQNKFLAPVGGGKKQMTALGEEVVKALPDQAAVKDIIATNKMGRSRKLNRKKHNQS